MNEIDRMMDDGCPHDLAQSPHTLHPMEQHEDLDSSTRICPCVWTALAGERITWSGLDDRLAAWTRIHHSHSDGHVLLRAEPSPYRVTRDGERAYSGPQPTRLIKL